MSKLFGTDGVRGVAGTPPLDPVTMTRLGAALVRVLPHRGAGRVLVGRDTRESGDWIEQALARGVASQGAQLVSTGIVPTPAVAYLTGSRDFDAGLVISASHNPFQDNGIKIFSGHGQKFAEAQERDIEALVADPAFLVDLDTPAAVTREDLVDAYLDHARAMLPSPGALRGARIGLDCANGATSTVAPRLFRALGFDVVRDRRRAGRAQHQPRVRLDASGAPLGAGAAGEAPLRRGVRWRRRSRDPDRRRRADRRRRRRALSVRHAHAGRRPPEGRRHRRHRDEQHRPRDRAARGRHRACCDAPSATST